MTIVAKALIAFLAITGIALAQTTSVAQFGALPDDGATDATPGIQAAINAAKGSRVFLPKDTPGSGGEVTAAVVNGMLTSLRVTNSGANYCKSPEIALTGGGGENAKVTARVDGACHLTSVTIDRPGSGYTSPPVVHVNPRLRCYKVSQIDLLEGTMLEGDGQASCIIPDGSNKPVIHGYGAYAFRLRNFSLIGDGVTDVGMQFNGAEEDNLHQYDGRYGSDSLLCTLDAVIVSGFRSKNIELNRTYGFLFLNVHSYGSKGWGLYLRDGFNNATQIVGGEYSSNGIGGLYIGTDSIQLYFSAIAEGNAKYGVYYRGHLTGLQISDAYFEGNGHNRTGWDVYGDFLDYDHPAIGVSIRNTLFNSLDAAYAAHIENTVDLEFAHNIGVPPLVGDPFEVNSVVLGKGVVNPRIEGNTALLFKGVAGVPIHAAPANFAENIFLRSSALNSRTWSCQNAGGPVTRDGTRFHNDGAAWKIPLAPASGASNMTTVTQTLTGVSGHLIGTGVWMRADSGTATVWLEISPYTGSTLNQPLRRGIDSHWQWISTNVSAESATGITLRLYANDGSPARAVYVYAPQAWLDVAGTPQYAATAASAISRRLQTPAATPIVTSQPDCKGQPNGIVGYDAAADKIWACSNGIAKAH